MSARAARAVSAGFTTVEAVVGSALGLATVVAALSLATGIARVADRQLRHDDRVLAAEVALERIARDVAAAGRGVDSVATPDEALELVADNALGVRADLDLDDPAQARAPEALLDPSGGFVATGNDEVCVWLRRTTRSGGRPVTFEADLDGTDRVPLPDGTPVARRDGVVETIDAGPAAAAADDRRGTLYRVHFVHDATRFGGGRFRVVVPVLSGVRAFRVRAFDAAGTPIGPCGGADSPAARSCRAAVRGIEVELGVDVGGTLFVLRRRIPPGGGEAAW